MQPELIDKLLRLNQDFYATYAQSFAATRHSVQPGVQRLLPMIMQAEVVLDLGCGNGNLAELLKSEGFCGSFYGVDENAYFLEQAETATQDAACGSYSFRQGSLASFNWLDLVDEADAICSFATLHHLPGADLHRQLFSSISDQSPDAFHQFVPRQKQGVVNCHQPTFVADQGTHFVNQAMPVLQQVHFATPCFRKQRGIQDGAVKQLRLVLETGNHWIEILAEGLHHTREVVQNLRTLCHSEKVGIEIGLNNFLRAASHGSDAERASVGKAIQNARVFHLLAEPQAQVARVGIEAGVLVEPEIQGVVHTIFFDRGGNLLAVYQHTLAQFDILSVAQFEQDALHLGQGFGIELGYCLVQFVPGCQVPIMVRDHQSVGEEINRQSRQAFIEAIKQS